MHAGPLTPRKVLCRDECRQRITLWKADQLVRTGLPCGPEGWLTSALRNDDATDSSVRVGSVTQIPGVLLLVVFAFLDVRALLYDTQLTCKLFRNVARHPTFWRHFRLGSLVLEKQLPVVTRFLELKHVFSTEREHREHFWMRHLSTGRWPAALHTLDLSKSLHVTARQLHQLLETVVIRGPEGYLRGVSCVNISMCESLDDDVVTALTEVLTAANCVLTTLDASFLPSRVSAATVQRLLASSSCRLLTELCMSACDRWSADDLHHLFANLDMAHSLVSLSCASSNVSCRVFLAQAFPSLTALDVSNSPLVDDDFLAALPSAAPSLRTLAVDGCHRVTDVGLCNLTGGQIDHGDLCEYGASQLSRINISKCFLVTDAGIFAVLSSCAALTRIAADGCYAVRGPGVLNGCAANARFRMQQKEVVSVSLVGCRGIAQEVLRNSALRKTWLEACEGPKGRHMELTVETRKYFKTFGVYLKQ